MRSTECPSSYSDDDDVVYRPMIIEVPHFASLRGEEREIAVLRSDDGQSWRQHVPPSSEDAVHEMLEGHFEGKPTSVLSSVFVFLFPLSGRYRVAQNASSLCLTI